MAENIDEDKNIKEALEEVELYQKGTLNLETWKYFKEELDLDEDIKLAKEVARELKLYVDGNKVRKGRAISTVVSELETYKKIVEKLAGVLSKRGIVYFEPVEPYKERTPIKKVTLNGKDEIIDWARKEVEKDACRTN